MRKATIAVMAATTFVLTGCSADGSSQQSNHRYPTINGVRQLSGEEAASLISGNSVVGYYESSNGSFVDFFASDGRFASSGFDGNVEQGGWTVEKDRVCVTETGGKLSQNRCITFITTNDQYVAFRPGGKGIFRITGIREGNFKNLPLE